MPEDTCLKCFHPVNPSDRSCPNCGAPLNRAIDPGIELSPPRIRVETSGEPIFMTLVSAGLFLWVGFGWGLTGISDSAVYNASVTALTWGARAVGIGLLCVAALTYLRMPFVLVIDLIVSVIASGGCLIVGVIWILHSDMSGALLLLFGVFNFTSARQAWVRFRRTRTATLPR